MSLDPDTQSKLEQIVTSDSVVLFMKGNRSFPQCGFSASVVSILNTLIPKYTTVNVLADAMVRDGMKQFSDGRVPAALRSRESRRRGHLQR